MLDRLSPQRELSDRTRASRAIGIVTDDPGWHGRQLQLAFAELGHDSRFLSLTECRIQVQDGCLPLKMPGFPDKLPAAVFVRGVPGGSLEQVVFYLDILHALKALGIPVYNEAGAVERSVDKAMTSFLLHRAGLPTPPTWVLQSREEALAIVGQEFRKGHMVLSKPLFGSQGEGIRRLEKTTDLLWLTPTRGVYYLQRFLACAGERYCDYRLLVVNRRVAAAMRRHGKFWLNNVAQGAVCEAVSAEPPLAELALKAADVLEMDYAGVDILRDRSGSYQIIEVNSIPAWKGLESVCGINIAALLAQDLTARRLAGARAEAALSPLG